MGAIEDILKRFGDETVDIIRTNMSSTGTNATGETSKSLEVKTKGKTVQVLGNEFIYTIETGRKAGKRPPVSSIMEWLQSGKAGISDNIESRAFAISKLIGEKGSSLFRLGGREDIITPAISNSRIALLMEEIANVSVDRYLNSIKDD